jgi:hypothetical protein
MSKEISNQSSKTYYTIVDGTFRTKVEETHPQAKKREVEMEDGSKKIKWERVVGALVGKIENIFIQDGTYGKTVNITLDKDSDGKAPAIQLGIDTGRYGVDFLKKLPNIDLSQDVMFRPFSFTPEGEDKKIQGLEIKQGESKIDNFFWDTKNKKPLNGYPELVKKTADMDKDDWKIHFLTANKHIVSYANTHILPKFRAQEVPAAIKRPKEESMPIEYPTEEINPEDIPF